MRSTHWRQSSLLRGPLPKADIETLRVFVEWRRQEIGIVTLARRAGYSAGRVRSFLLGLPVRHQSAMARDLAEALGLNWLIHNEGGYTRTRGGA